MQLGENKKIFEFVYVECASEAHVLAAKALLLADTASDDKGSPKVHGEAFFVTDDKPQYFFDFAREAYAAAGHPVAPNEIIKMPFGVVRVMASTGEWAYWIFTLGRLTPQMRRQNIDHLDKGCHWSIEKARQRLGYAPVLDQSDAIKRSMEWAIPTRRREGEENMAEEMCSMYVGPSP